MHPGYSKQKHESWYGMWIQFHAVSVVHMYVGRARRSWSWMVVVAAHNVNVPNATELRT